MPRMVALIHGYGLDYRIWWPVELAFEGCHVIHLSLPGYGEERVEDAYTIEQLAARFWEGIDPRMAPTVHLVGMSMGGYVAIAMAAQQPQRLESLALVHSHVFADSEEKKAARTSTLEFISTHGRAAFAAKMIPSLFADSVKHHEIAQLLIRRGIEYEDKAWCYGMRAMRDRKDHAATLAYLTVPVLMLMGEKDVAVPVNVALRQSHIAERGTFHLYPETGRMGMYECTDKMITDLIRFYHTLPA